MDLQILQEGGSPVLLDTICAVALYCQRCGQVHIQDVPYFIGQGERVLRCPNCSHEQAEIALRPQKGLVLRIPCGVCGTENRFGYSMQQLRKLRFEKMWSKLKAFLRKWRIRTTGFLPGAIDKAIRKITKDDCRGWFTCCGYSICEETLI